MRSAIPVAAAALLALALTTPAQSHQQTKVTNEDGKTIVNAPTTDVEAAHDGSEVDVDAPYTSVKVDTRKRVVKIRVPYFNQDIEW